MQKLIDINVFTNLILGKKTLNKKYGFPLTMTESEMVKNIGFDRIWDCGLFKFVWTNEDVKKK